MDISVNSEFADDLPEDIYHSSESELDDDDEESFSPGRTLQVMIPFNLMTTMA
jgi:hypothetical protein